LWPILNRPLRRDSRFGVARPRSEVSRKFSNRPTRRDSRFSVARPRSDASWNFSNRQSRRDSPFAFLPPSHHVSFRTVHRIVALGGVTCDPVV
jgi:hypothetical protein